MERTNRMGETPTASSMRRANVRWDTFVAAAISARRRGRWRFARMNDSVAATVGSTSL
jgi:hypothetical protein